MSGRSCSAKNFAVIAAIALPLFVPTGAINLALSETATALSSSSLPFWTQLDYEIYSELSNLVKPSDGLVGYPKVGWVMYYPSPEEEGAYNVYHEAYEVYKDRVRKSEMKIPYLMDFSIKNLVMRPHHVTHPHHNPFIPDPTKAVLSALYAPVELDGTSYSSMEHSKSMLSLCWTYATPYQFSLTFPDIMNTHYLRVMKKVHSEVSFFQYTHPTNVNGTPALKISYHAVNILPLTTELPNIKATLEATETVTFLKSITDVVGRKFVEEQFQGLIAIINHPRYPAQLLEEGGECLEEAIGIFLKWLMKFAKIHPSVFGCDDSLFLRPFFEATLAAMNEEFENPTASLEQEIYHLHV